jgi:hypothetical protein
MRVLIGASCAVTATLLLAACSSTPPATPRADSSTGPASPTSAAVPATAPLTGAQLKPLLAPAAWFPAGFSFDASGAVDSGPYYDAAPAQTGLSCIALNGLSWIELGGVASVSFAQNDYIDKDTSEEYAQEIDVFRGNGAQAAMAGVRNAALRCSSFPDSQTGGTITAQLAAGPALGDDSFTIILSDPRWLGGTALEAVRVGSAVITVLVSVDSSDAREKATGLTGYLTRALTGALSKAG